MPLTLLLSDCREVTLPQAPGTRLFEVNLHQHFEPKQLADAVPWIKPILYIAQAEHTPGQLCQYSVTAYLGGEPGSGSESKLFVKFTNKETGGGATAYLTPEESHRFFGTPFPDDPSLIKVEVRLMPVRQPVRHV